MNDDTISRQAALDAIKKLEKPAPTAQHLSAIFDCEDTIKALPSVQLAQDLPNGCTDTISRVAAISICDNAIDLWNGQLGTGALVAVRDAIMALPPAQPNLSEAYSKAVFTWLMGYQIRTAELKGRYTPYEVLSWVVNDWRKEHERFD